jgi:ribosomal protein S18 acetylase RimI-like enzyme
MNDAGLLDNPTWSALTTQQTALARRNELAARYEPSIAPFAAVQSMTPAAFDALARLLDHGESVLVQTQTEAPSFDGLRWEFLFSALQMIDDAPAPDDVCAVERLGANDTAAMVDLTKRTNPGPFAARAIETGNYIGLHEHGRLIAMAGERMRLDGFVEISAVCVDDAHRGKGIAGRLMNVLRREIRQRGEVPFLHVRGDNASAIGLYRRLGFSDRKMYSLYRVTRV